LKRSRDKGSHLDNCDRFQSHFPTEVQFGAGEVKKLGGGDRARGKNEYSFYHEELGGIRNKMKIVVGISGASGAIYGIRLLEALYKVNVESHLILSKTAIQTIEYETEYKIEQVKEMATCVYDNGDLGAAVSSGSFKVDGMVVAPCSIKTLSGIANSYNTELLTRAADVTLKERRKLVLMVRETPLHLGHLKQMTEVTRMGGVILPPMPSFYHLPKTVDDIINQTVQKILDQFGVEANLFKRWEGMDKKKEAAVQKRQSLSIYE
jgi:4-hydroxy-3-polyprenylbenzoate decarboxylase